MNGNYVSPQEMYTKEEENNKQWDKMCRIVAISGIFILFLVVGILIFNQLRLK
tara:strand:- start:593 stop:751 length:159 start_codon:yes stop_codon:yes gene_type:complete